MTESTAPTANTSPTEFRPAGYSTLTPFLCVAGAAKAIDFYRDVFGATLVSRMDAPDGTVGQAELQFEQGRLQLADPVEGYGLAPHDGAAPATHSLAIYVPDCDAVVAAAQKAGATVREQPSTFVTGDRYGSILDPFGVRWSVMTRVENVSDAEAEKRVKEWMAAQG
ncbi:MAG: VOC family protein [Nakamurella sp.]